MSDGKSNAPASGFKAIIAKWRDAGRETVTVPMVAKALRVSPQTVRGLGVPEAGIGRIVRYYLDDLERHLDKLAAAKAAG